MHYSRRVLPMFLLTYLLVFLIPLAGSIIAYIQYAGILEEEIVRSNLQSIAVAREEIDRMLQDVESLANDIAKNEYVRKFIGFRQPLGAAERMVQSRIINDQPFNLDRLPLVLDYYIYFKNNDRIIHSTGAIRPELFYRYITSYEHMSFEEWISALRGMEPTYRQVQPARMLIRSKTVNTFNYIQTLPISGQWSAEAAVVIMLDTEKIHSLLAQAAMGGYACVMNRGGELMLDAGDPTLMPDPGMLTYERSQPLEIGGRKMVVVAQVSDKLQWKFISVVPEEVFLDKLNAVRGVMYWTYGVSGLMGVMAAGFFAYRGYRPIRSMVQTLIGREESRDQRQRKIRFGRMNEYDYIVSSIAETLGHNRQLERRIVEIAAHDTEISELVSKNSALIKHSLLNSLLEGGYDDEKPILAWLDYHSVRFREPQLLVMLVHISDPSGFVREGSPQDTQTLKYAVMSIAEELAAERCFAVSSVVRDDLIALVLNPKHLEEHQVQDFVAPIIEIMENVFEYYFKVTVDVSVGCLVNSVKELHVSCQRALELVDRKLAAASVAGYEAAQIVRPESFYRAASEIKLMNAVRAGDYQLCAQQLDSILRKQALQGQIMKNTAFYIVGTVTKALDSVRIDLSDIFPEDFNLTGYLLEGTTAEDMRERILYMFDEICRHIDDGKLGRPIKLRQQILEYINNNIHDPNLSQTLVAEGLEISSSYLSKLFKKECGVSMVEYISRMRVEKAKELLRSTVEPLEEIARRVGYTNSKTLIRVFKQFEGVTPGRYRGIGGE